VNGKIAASTVFTSGHGYDSVSFSTQTLLIDVASAQIIADVEAFSVQRDGKPFKNKDFNFWGVTFSPDSRYFYATLSTQRQHLLVKGDIAARSAVVIHDNVECPSLSPDGKRIAYKKRLNRPGNVAWQLHVFDLASGKDTPLAEKRSVDDQLEWFNDEFLLYTLPDSETRATPVTNVWRIGADGNTPPELFLKNAYSPAVVR
jgi:Tol biopolymer transport system component